MKRNALKLITILVIIFFTLLSFVACNNEKEENTITTTKLTNSNYSKYLILTYSQTNIGTVSSNDWECFYKIEGKMLSRSRKFEFKDVKLGFTTGPYGYTPLFYCELTDIGYGEFSYNNSYSYNFPEITLYVVSVEGYVIESK